MTDKVTTDARQLSSGTIAGLIDNSKYTVIDKARADFVEFCEENSGKFEDWVQAWTEYKRIVLKGKSMTNTLTPTLLTRKQAKPILDATFPAYRGRKIKVKFTETVNVNDTNWSGGTRNQYQAIGADGLVVDLTANVPAPWVNPIEGTKIELTENFLIVEHSHFCGKDCGITIYSHPSNSPKILEREVTR